MACCPESRDDDLESRDDDKVALLKSLTDAQLMAYVDGVLDARGVGEHEALGEVATTANTRRAPSCTE